MSTTRIARRHRIDAADYCPGESTELNPPVATLSCGFGGGIYV